MTVKPTQILLDEYVADGDITLKNSRRLLILLNVLGIPWFIISAAFFIVMAGMLGPSNGGTGSGSREVSLSFLLQGLLVLAATTAGVLVIHELIHGLFFWLFTRSRPRFGFTGAYAYAAAPGWYIPKTQFLVVGLAPLVIISLLGLLLMSFIALPFSIVLVLALVMNASGAIGDLYMVMRLLRLPCATLCEDEGDSVRWFVPLSKSR